ncbi:unnamed protein product [Urochloa decumbens]|uniref:Uncharacterized protein n=1 Tax=Urochloa decumbens TaxID=240449 RepID=A0ABC9C2Y5_9POAL
MSGQNQIRHVRTMFREGGRTCRTYPEDSDHVGVGELVGALEGEEDVGEIGGGGGGVGAGAGEGAVLVDDAADEAVDAWDESGAPGACPLQVESGEPGEMVGPVELAEEVVSFVHKALELRRLLAAGQQLVPPPEHRPHHVVQRRALQEPPRRRRRAAALRRQGGHHLARDGGALGGGGDDLARGEEVVGGDAAEGAPVGAVRGEADGAVEEEPVRRLLHGAVGEGRAGEKLPRHVRVGGDHDAGLAEGERHQPAPVGLAGGGRGELAVREAGHEAHAAEHREPAGTRDGGGAASNNAQAGLPGPPVPPPRGPAGGGPVEERREEEGGGEDRGEAEKAVRVAAFGGQGEVQQPPAVVGRWRHG